MLTSLAYYFGWVYLREQYQQYGTSPTAVGYTRSEIVFRSLSVFVPAATRWVVAAMAFWVVTLALMSLARRGRRPIADRTAPLVLPAALALVSTLLIIVALVALPDFELIEQGVAAEQWMLVVFVALAFVAVTIVEYVGFDRGWNSGKERRRRVRQNAIVAQTIAALALLISALFTVRSVATDAGLRAACEWEVSKHVLGEATIVGDVVLGLNARTLGIDEEAFVHLDQDEPPPEDGLPYRLTLSPTGPYEYGGLRILTRAGGRLWVFPALGTPRNGLVGLDLDSVVAVGTHRSDSREIKMTPLCERLL